MDVRRLTRVVLVIVALIFTNGCVNTPITYRSNNYKVVVKCPTTVDEEGNWKKSPCYLDKIDITDWRL